MCSMPSTVVMRAGDPAVAGQQADREVGARALVVQGVEAALGQAAGGARRARPCAPPRPRRGRARRGGRRAGSAPRACPARASASRSGWTSSAHPRSGRGRPSSWSSARRATCEFSLTRGQPVAAGAHRVEALEQPRGDGAGEARCARRARRPARARARRTRTGRSRACPSGACSMRARLTHGSNQRDVDELRARLVGLVGDRAGEVLLAGLAADGDDLARLDVGADLHGELGERGGWSLVDHDGPASRARVDGLGGAAGPRRPVADEHGAAPVSAIRRQRRHRLQRVGVRGAGDELRAATAAVGLDRRQRVADDDRLAVREEERGVPVGVAGRRDRMRRARHVEHVLVGEGAHVAERLGEQRAHPPHRHRAAQDVPVAWRSTECSVS